MKNDELKQAGGRGMNETRKPPAAPASVGMFGNMKQAAAYISVSRRTLFNWISEGRLKVIRHSKRKIFIRPSDLLKAVEEIGADYSAKNGEGGA